jgi:teichuronic acid biosynthesis glycosyltransferase TuaH
MPSTLDRLVVICGASWWGGTPLLEQHLATEVSAYVPVLYVNPPTSALTKFRSPTAASSAGPPGLRQVHEHIHVLSVRVAPLMEKPGVKQLSLVTTRRAIARAVRKLGRPRVEALIVTTLDPLFGCAGEQSSVLYIKDDYFAGAQLTGIPARRLAVMSRRLPARADLVVTVSDVLADGIREPAIHPLVIPNGVDVSKFTDAKAPPDGRFITAFVGHLSERVDVRFLEAVADSGVHLRMIGPLQETMHASHLDGLAKRANVEWVGSVAYEQLGTALSDVTTCLVPYGDSAFNRASFPLKILEYLAAGRRVVSTDLPAARWLRTHFVDLASTPEAFGAAVGRSLTTPLSSEEISERRSFASRHSWTSRVEVLAAHLGLGDPAHSTLSEPFHDVGRMR